MDSHWLYFYFPGTTWMILLLFTIPDFTHSSSCPSSCRCSPQGAAMCTGSTIADIPPLPLHTYLLQLSVTNMNVLNERSLANLDLLLRFSLIKSHLHTVHPQAFLVAPQLKSVKLSSNDLSTLPPRVFSPLAALEQLHLDGNQFENIHPDMFEGLGGLQDLDLSRNKLRSLDSDIFEGLTNLTFLNLGRNFIKKLPPTIFHSLTKLQQLILYYNELEFLEAGIFDKLINLVELKLHQNQIASLPPKVFWPLGNLKILTLSSNQLQAIPEKSFYNMPKLVKLTIYKNPLLSLPDELMGHMPDMTEFYLYATNLITVPGNLFANMSGLLMLNFHLNDNLRDLPPDVFCCLPNLQKLSLKSNNLHYLHPHLFSKLTTLKKLHLNDNKLYGLPEGIFKGLGEILEVLLNNNNLSSLPGDIFVSLPALMNLTLSGNPWDCNCAIRGIARWMRHNEHVLWDRDDVMCHTPVYQLLRTVGSLRDEEFSFCSATTAKSFPLQYLNRSPTQPLHMLSTTGQTSALTSITTPPTTAAQSKDAAIQTTQGATQKVPDKITTQTVKATTSDDTTLSASLPTELIGKFAQNMSPPFYGILVIEPGPEFVHHNHQKGWVYVWFLPSHTALTGFLMFFHILLVAAGLSLILATMYGMYRLHKAMYKLKAECACNEA